MDSDGDDRQKPAEDDHAGLVRALQRCDEELIDVVLAAPTERDLPLLRRLNARRRDLLRRLHLTGLR